MTLTYDISVPPGGFITAEGDLRRLADRLVKDVSDRAASNAKRMIREDMKRASLGRLGNAIGHTSDKIKGEGVQRRGDVSRASGVVFIRSRSPRTVGAIISYTEGATITPKKSRWLWIPTDRAQRLVGTGKERRRLTPALWRSRGLDRKIGPLVQIRSINGNPLLVVNDVGVSAVGARGGRARSLTKSGRPRKGDRGRELVVMFIGIPNTSRAARVNPQARAFQAAQQAIAELRGV